MFKFHFSDEISAFGGIKKARFKDKGKYSCKVAVKAYEALGEAGISTWFLEAQGERDILCREVTRIPLRFIVRNRLVGSLVHMVGGDFGAKIPGVIHEVRLLRADLCNPMINSDYAVALGYATGEQMDTMLKTCDRANEVLKEMFLKAGIELVDFRLEFGIDEDGRTVVASAISPDTARLWDISDGRVLDKDRFRQDLSDVCASYREVMERL